MNTAVDIFVENQRTCLDTNCQGHLNLNEVARQYAVRDSSPTPEQLKLNGVARSFNTRSGLTYSSFKPGLPVHVTTSFSQQGKPERSVLICLRKYYTTDKGCCIQGWDSNQFWVVVDGTFLPGMDQGLKFKCHIQWH